MGFFSGFFGKALEAVGIVAASALLGPEVGAAFGVSASAGGAIVGATLGAGISAASGGTIAQDVIGGLGGAVGGYNAGATVTGIENMASSASKAISGAFTTVDPGTAIMNQADASLTSEFAAQDTADATEAGVAGGTVSASTAVSGGAGGFLDKTLGSSTAQLAAGTMAVSSMLSQPAKVPTNPLTAIDAQAATDAATTAEEEEAARQARGGFGNMLTSPTGVGNQGQSASQRLLGIG